MGEWQSFPLSVGCLGGARVPALFFLSIQDVLPQMGARGGRGRATDLGKLEKGSLGHMQACFDHILLF